MVAGRVLNKGESVGEARDDGHMPAPIDTISDLLDPLEAGALNHLPRTPAQYIEDCRNDQVLGDSAEKL